MIGNRPYRPAEQVPLAEITAARDTIQRMLDGGELLSNHEGGMLAAAVAILDESITAAHRRARKANPT